MQFWQVQPQEDLGNRLGLICYVACIFEENTDVDKLNAIGLDQLNECYFCKNSEESADHIIVICPKIQKI